MARQLSGLAYEGHSLASVRYYNGPVEPMSSIYLTLAIRSERECDGKVDWWLNKAIAAEKKETSSNA